MKSEGDNDKELFKEISEYKNGFGFRRNKYYCIKSLHINWEQLIRSPMSHYQIVMLQNLAATILQATAFTLRNWYTDTGLNKQMYIADKMSCHMLKLAAIFGCISDLVLNAMIFYKLHMF